MLTVALIVMIVGLILYFAAANNAKLAEVGRIMFQVGLFFVLVSFGGQVLRL